MKPLENHFFISKGVTLDEQVSHFQFQGNLNEDLIQNETTLWDEKRSSLLFVFDVVVFAVALEVNLAIVGH